MTSGCQMGGRKTQLIDQIEALLPTDFDQRENSQNTDKIHFVPKKFG